MFCGDRLPVSYPRPSRIDGAKHSWTVLALPVKRLREAWLGFGSQSAGTPASAAGACCSGSTATVWTTSSAWRGTRAAGDIAACTPWRSGAIGRRARSTPVRRRALRRAPLGRRPARDRQGRARPPRRQPALRRDQPRGRRAPHLRARLLRRGDMESRLSSTALRPETNLIPSPIDANRGRIVSLMQYPG